MDATQSSTGDWHVAASSVDLGADPLGRIVNGIKLVLFRQADGRIAALRDLCPHQDLPLSTGWVVNGTVECLHHGLRFDGTGKCVNMPAQDPKHIPERFKVQTFPVRDEDGRILVRLSTAAS